MSYRCNYPYHKKQEYKTLFCSIIELVLLKEFFVMFPDCCGTMLFSERFHLHILVLAASSLKLVTIFFFMLTF